MAKNYYGVLGLAQNATDEDVRRRFKKLAREKHPDRFQGEEKLRVERDFQALTEAFNVLTDPERRRVHDDSVDRVCGRREIVEDLALRVGLERLQSHIELGRQSLKRGIDIRQRGAAVDLRFPSAEELEVRPVDDHDLQGFSSSSVSSDPDAGLHARSASR